MKHIICFHLLNDYSGSPKVLNTVLKGLLDKGYPVDLYTSDGGALDELLPHKNLRKISCHYHFSTNPVLTLLRFFRVQVITFILAFRYLFDRNAVFYINTVLPCGPALAGWLMRKRVIYHCHEFILKKGWTYKLLGKLMQMIATEIICVSQDQRKTIGREKGVVVIPNALPDEFSRRLSSASSLHMEQKTVLMLSSLKSYKGISEFIKLAHLLPKYHFLLVLNDTEENIFLFFKENELDSPANMSIYPRQKDVIPFYTRSSLVLNLSDKGRFIETSGLTVIEAMMAGLPVIVPTVGGISEMVRDGVNGYKIDAQNIEAITKKIDQLLSDRKEYERMHCNALKVRQQFSAACMIDSVLSLL